MGSRVDALAVAIGFLAIGLVSCDPGNQPSVPDFELATSPTAATVPQGASMSLTISGTRVGGFTGDITLSLSDPPDGVSWNLGPEGDSRWKLALTAGAAAPLTGGPVPVTVFGTSGPLSHTTAFSLVVVKGIPDFALAVSPASNVVVQGGGAIENIKSSALYDFSGDIALSFSGLPPGVTGSISPPSVTAGSSAALTLAAGESAPLGTGTVTVTGTSGSNTHSVTFTLRVMEPPAP